MPAVLWQPTGTAQDERDREGPAARDEAAARAELPALSLPLPAPYFHITDLDQWMDLCA
jgi:hypothetical protein